MRILNTLILKRNTELHENSTHHGVANPPIFGYFWKKWSVFIYVGWQHYVAGVMSFFGRVVQNLLFMFLVTEFSTHYHTPNLLLKPPWAAVVECCENWARDRIWMESYRHFTFGERIVDFIHWVINITTLTADICVHSTHQKLLEAKVILHADWKSSRLNMCCTRHQASIPHNHMYSSHLLLLKATCSKWSIIFT